jgi:formylglycine-generating enzyme required for sulfatase activity
VLALGVDLARVLADAHPRGVIHGDIKPANAMVAEDGTAKLLDFGLATLADAAPAGGKARAIHGTPDYMAPELWRGQAADRRSDVYAFGAVLYHLLTGQPPFHDVPPRDLARVVQDRDAPALGRRSGDARLAAAIDRCLARDAGERFASGDELREALEQCRDRAAVAIPGGNPYRGLRPFEADHRELFFGRGAELGVVVDRLRAESLVVVSGDSGSGKSSLCRAAVLPAIADGAIGHGRTWTSVQLVPGRRPLQALAAALAGALDVTEDAATAALRGDNAAVRAFFRSRLGSDTGVVVFCDQLEELVTIADRDEAAAADRALARLGAGVGGVRVLATARADFLGRLAALPDLGDSLTRALMFLRPLGPDEIRAVIVGPAEATGVRFESEAMVDELVAATAGAAQERGPGGDSYGGSGSAVAGGADGGLPLLQFALAELWTARDAETDTITAAALASLGGVDGALARHADSVLAALPPAQAAAARRILTRLVTPAGTRARRGDAELTGGDPAAAAALDALVRGRLLVAHEADDGSAYELSHEVLLRGWGTLRGWLVEDADQRLLADRVHAAATEWERLHRGADALWGARQLGEAVRVRETELAAIDRQFLAASRRKVSRRRWLVRGAIVAVPALVVAIYAGVEIANQRALDRKVARLRAAAHDQFAAARALAARADAHRARAFALFDAPDLDAGEPTERAEAEWTLAVETSLATVRGLAHASRAFEVALSADPSRADVRRELGEVLLTRAERADREGRHADRDDLIDRLPLYDPDGGLMRSWTTPAPLALAIRPPTATVVIRADRPDAAPAPPPAALAPGSYVIEASAPGHASVRLPVVATRGQRLDIAFALPPAAAVPAGMIAIPPGRFQFGSAADEGSRRFFETAPAHARDSPGFLIGEHEVTFAAWIEFLDALDPAARAPHVPSAEGDVTVGGGVRLERVANGWALRFDISGQPAAARIGEPIRYPARDRRREQSWSRFPVTGISALDAEAYVAWLDRTGRVPGARLCSEAEWERAARGADGRIYPHGDQIGPDDANFDETYGKRAGAVGLDEIGSHPRSTSPFGVADMTGNAFEWTRSVLGPGHVLRGGGFFYDRKTIQVVNRGVVIPTVRSAILGMRVCAPWPA